MKTAVEFLESKIFGDEIFSLSKVFEQAKEIERQQIIDAYIRGNYKSNRDMYWKEKDANKYYNETFNR